MDDFTDLPFPLLVFTRKVNGVRGVEWRTLGGARYWKPWPEGQPFGLKAEDFEGRAAERPEDFSLYVVRPELPPEGVDLETRPAT